LMHSLRLLISARWPRGVSRHGDVGISRRAEPEAVGSIPGLNMAFHESCPDTDFLVNNILIAFFHEP